MKQQKKKEVNEYMWLMNKSISKNTHPVLEARKLLPYNIITVRVNNLDNYRNFLIEVIMSKKTFQN